MNIFKALIAKSAMALAALSLMTASALADKVVSMSKTGSSSNRVDLVILGDGYKASQMAKFRKDAAAFKTKFFAASPYLEYKNFFNVTRIEKSSKVSGAGNGKGKNTAYGAYYGCFQVDRLLCIDEAKVRAVLSKNLAGNAHDMVIVIVNDDKYGGSGGTYAVASTNEFAGDIAIHEFGHSFGHLDDEYVDTFNCGRYTNPWGFNVTKEKTRSKIPWKSWIRSTTPLPTPDSRDPLVGAYKGAFFCATGWYRPTFNSMMRSLGMPFGPVNSEQIIRQIYGVVDPVDKSIPVAKSVKLTSVKKSFRILGVDPALASLSVTWRLNDKVIGTGATIFLTKADLPKSSNTLTATVRDKTGMVRSDPKRLLIEKRSWTVTR